MKIKKALWMCGITYCVLLLLVTYIIFQEEMRVVFDGSIGKIIEAYNTTFKAHSVYTWGAVILGIICIIVVAIIFLKDEMNKEYDRIIKEQKDTIRTSAPNPVQPVQNRQVTATSAKPVQISAIAPRIITASDYTNEQNHMAYTAIEHSDRAQKLAAAESLTDGLLCLGVLIGTHDVGVLNIVKVKADKSGKNGDIIDRYLACQEGDAPMTDSLMYDMAHAYKRIFADNYQALLARGYMRSAEKSILNAIDKASTSELRIEALYNLGIFNWSFIGRGEKAMEAFEQVWQSASEEASTEQSRLLASNASENAMMLCSSAEEFITWRERLRSTSPEQAILSEIGQTFPNRYDDGTPWWECMTELANGLYNRVNPSIDSGRYGNGASMWRNMLLNRKKLRLPVEAWRNAAQEYGILALRLLGVEARKTGSWWCAFDGYETAYPIYEALDLVAEYVAAYPGGFIEHDILGDIKKNIALGDTDFNRLWK